MFIHWGADQVAEDDLGVEGHCRLSHLLREGSTECERSCAGLTTPQHNQACWFSDRSTRNSARRAICHLPPIESAGVIGIERVKARNSGLLHLT